MVLWYKLVIPVLYALIFIRILCLKLYDYLFNVTKSSSSIQSNSGVFQKNANC